MPNMKSDLDELVEECLGKKDFWMWAVTTTPHAELYDLERRSREEGEAQSGQVSVRCKGGPWWPVPHYHYFIHDKKATRLQARAAL